MANPCMSVPHNLHTVLTHLLDSDQMR